MEEDVLHRLADLIDHPADRGLGHPGPPAMADLDQPDGLQRLHRLADGGTPDPDPLHEFAFGGQGLARPDRPALDQVEQLAADLAGNLLAADSVSHQTSVAGAVRRGKPDGSGGPWRQWPARGARRLRARCCGRPEARR